MTEQELILEVKIIIEISLIKCKLLEEEKNIIYLLFSKSLCCYLQINVMI